jgi:hypothetical protein
MYLWALLAFFAFDNVMSWLSSPIFFYPLVFIGGIIMMLYSMGMGPILVPVARQSINLILR